MGVKLLGLKVPVATYSCKVTLANCHIPIASELTVQAILQVRIGGYKRSSRCTSKGTIQVPKGHGCLIIPSDQIIMADSCSIRLIKIKSKTCIKQEVQLMLIGTLEALSIQYSCGF